MIALNFGAGTKKKEFEGYEKTINVDIRPEVKPDLVADIFAFPKQDQPIGLIYTSHFLEHFGALDGRRIMRQFHDILAPGGKIWTVVPNLEFAAVQILKDGEPNGLSMDILYGHQEYETNFHKYGFTPRSMRKFMEISGLWTNISSKSISNNFEVELKAEKV